MRGVIGIGLPRVYVQTYSCEMRKTLHDNEMSQPLTGFANLVNVQSVGVNVFTIVHS